MAEGAGHRPISRSSSNLFEIFCFVALAIVAVFRLPAVSFDDSQYIAMAEGRFEQIMAPFSGRVLVPYLSAAVHSIFGFPIAFGFSAIALAGVVLLLVGIHCVYRQYGVGSYAWLPATLAVPWMVDALRDPYLPDTLVMGLTCTFLLLLSIRNAASWLFAGMVAVLLILARETGLILVLLAIGFALLQRRWSFAAMLAGLTFGGLIALKHIAKSAPNIHDMNGLLYLVLKIPVNLLGNVAGVQFWLNDMAWCDHPLMTVHVGAAAASFFGKINTIGVCAPNVMAPIATAALVLSIFGVLPGLALALMRRNRQVLIKDPWLSLVVLYGGTMFVLGTCTGASVYRLLTYGWPLFIFGIPILWKAHFEDEPFTRAHLLAIQLGLCWLGPILGSLSGTPQWWRDDAIACALGLFGALLNVWAYRVVVAKGNAMGTSLPHKLSSVPPK
jgi:hypothetical protein